MSRFELHLGDCLETLRTMPDNSVDSIVTDPPYGLSFMGKKWDYDVPSVEIWAECLRVLKPGGHLLAFAGTRTQHRMAVRIEDAGFEIRDMIAWVYGSGFPKSLDVSKAIDKAAGVEGSFGEPKSAAHAGWIERGRMRGDEGHEGYQRPWMADTEAVDKNARKYIGGTEAARQWQGWGTALKPALEPITVARKPLVGTVAANVLQHGTGAPGIGCIECKQPVIEAILKEQQPMMERAQTYLDDPSLLRAIIADGCDKARKTAQETMRDVREAMGLDYS